MFSLNNGCGRLREQWQAEEGSRVADETRSVRQRPNPGSPSVRLESIEGLLADVEKGCHQGTINFLEGLQRTQGCLPVSGICTVHRDQPRRNTPWGAACKPGGHSSL